MQPKQDASVGSSIKEINLTGSPQSKKNNLLLESDIEKYAKEVVQALIKKGIPPTPNNYALYFEKLLDDKSQSGQKAIKSVLEQEEENDDENSMLLEQSLKKGFGSVKNILALTANIYKNISLMTKILDKRKQDLKSSSDDQSKSTVVEQLFQDVAKLETILSTQNSTIKTLYDETLQVVKSVENETIFDNQFGVYNKRYLLTKLTQEIDSISKQNHKSTLIMIELDKKLQESIKNEKAILLMGKNIARLLLKTSRRSDVVAHYGNGTFVMLLRHTDVESAKKASERLSELVSNSTFFLGESEVTLTIAIGITEIKTSQLAEEIIVNALDAIENSYGNQAGNYAVI
ncbi:MAG: GGDEF domain-containing protein [Sulfuricurvum sp.]|jgi:diguanylate cyclase (GGDEF)-like protein